MFRSVMRSKPPSFNLPSRSTKGMSEKMVTSDPGATASSISSIKSSMSRRQPTSRIFSGTASSDTPTTEIFSMCLMSMSTHDVVSYPCGSTRKGPGTYESLSSAMTIS
jgi:hypothetical protein